MRGSLHYTIWTLLLSISWVSASENFELFASKNRFREVYGLTLDRILPLLNAGITERQREFREEFVDPPCNATTVAEARRLNDDAVCYGDGKDDPTKSLIPFQSLNLPDCDPGWYCPNVCPGVPGGDAQICAPNKKCLLDRLVTRHCPPQGVFEPSLCEPGTSKHSFPLNRFRKHPWMDLSVGNIFTLVSLLSLLQVSFVPLRA